MILTCSVQAIYDITLHSASDLRKFPRVKHPAPSARRSACPLNATLEALGDRWSLLVVRDLLLKGRRSYRAFLDAEEGIATNILADRLRRLEAEGVLGKARDPDDARRFVYRLTRKGLDLAPMLVEMILWGAKHYATAAPAGTVREMTEQRERFLAGVYRRATER